MSVLTIHSPITSNVACLKSPQIKNNNGQLSPPIGQNYCMKQRVISDNLVEPSNSEFKCDRFGEMRNRFLNFKQHKYMNNLELFRSLAQEQKPKFMVIACADSRVCPSTILGFQPGEAFVVRNIANLVPSFEHGPSETNAALEYAVNSLKVEHILVIGHSCCGGIKALMSMQDRDSSFISSWVALGKKARSTTEASVSDLTFEQQCGSCEKESVRESMKNCMTYGWLEERARKRMLYVHGGYYDFVHCTFEMWSLGLMKSEIRYAFTDSLLWS